MAENTPQDEVTKVMTDALGERFTQEATLHVNVAQDAIVITEDKVRLCLMKNWSRIESGQRWIAPAGVLISILATIVTTEFKDYYLSAASWETIFWLVGLVTSCWLLIAIVRIKRSPSIEDIVSEMKQASKGSRIDPNK